MQTLTNPFDISNNLLTQGAQAASDAISPESRNRAAARLRADLDIQRNRLTDTTNDTLASTGSLNSGRADMARRGITGSYFDALSKGLGTMENQYAQNAIQAGGVLNQSGAQMGSNANNQANIKQNALNTYIQGGNALADPTGAGSQAAFGSLGLDVSGLGFFGPQGTTNPISVPGGGSSGGSSSAAPGTPTLGGGGLNSNAGVEQQAETILQGYQLGSPVVMSSEFTATPLGNYLYNRLIALTGNRVRLIPASIYRSDQPFMTDRPGSPGTGGYRDVG